MIFKYELRFVAFTWPNLCSLDLSLLFTVLVGRNFVSGTCKLHVTSKNPKKHILFKKIDFFSALVVTASSLTLVKCRRCLVRCGLCPLQAVVKGCKSDVSSRHLSLLPSAGREPTSLVLATRWSDAADWSDCMSANCIVCLTSDC